MKRDDYVAQNVLSSSSKVLNRSFLFKPCPSKMVMPSWRVVSKAAAMASAPKAFSIVMLSVQISRELQSVAGSRRVLLGWNNQCDYLHVDSGVQMTAEA